MKERPQVTLARLVAANLRPPMRVTRPRVHLFARPLPRRESALPYYLSHEPPHCPTCDCRSHTPPDCPAGDAPNAELNGARRASDLSAELGAGG